MAELTELQKSRLVLDAIAARAMVNLQSRLDSEFEWSIDLFNILAPIYMKPNTATAEASMIADAARDAKYLGIAVDAVIAEMRARRPSAPAPAPVAAGNPPQLP